MIPTQYLLLVMCLGSADSASGVATVARDTGARHDTITRYTAVKPNLTLIGAIVVGIDTLDSLTYSVDIELRTAIPERGFASFVEPGQQIRIVPSFELDERGMIDVAHQRNRRLMEVRGKKVGDFLFGKISMGSDSTWYLLDTEFR